MATTLTQEEKLVNFLDYAMKHEVGWFQDIALAQAKIKTVVTLFFGHHNVFPIRRSASFEELAKTGISPRMSGMPFGSPSRPLDVFISMVDIDEKTIDQYRRGFIQPETLIQKAGGF